VEEGKNRVAIVNKISPRQTNTVRCVSFQLQQTESTTSSSRRGQNPIPPRVLSSISIIHIDPCALDVRTGPFVRFHTSKEFISVDLCYNDSKTERERERERERGEGGRERKRKKRADNTQRSQLIQYSFTAACVYAS